MNTGDKLNYFGKPVEVVESNTTHVLIKLKSGAKICTDKLAFNTNNHDSNTTTLQNVTTTTYNAIKRDL
jgi:hypothetical protein